MMSAIKSDRVCVTFRVCILLCLIYKAQKESMHIWCTSWLIHVMFYSIVYCWIWDSFGVLFTNHSFCILQVADYQPTNDTCVIADPRLSSINNPDCKEYENIERGIVMSRLYDAGRLNKNRELMFSFEFIFHKIIKDFHHIPMENLKWIKIRMIIYIIVHTHSKDSIDLYL